MNPRFEIRLDTEFALTEFLTSDQPSLVHHLKCREIYENTIGIPFPYKDEDAEWWISEKQKELERNGRPVTFVIRDKAKALIGAVGFDGMSIGQDHRAEIGYWLAKEYWGKGIVAAAVHRMCQLGFTEFGLDKITAHVFAKNIQSQRIMEKCRFEREGLLKRHIKKDGNYIDMMVFGKCKALD